MSAKPQAPFKVLNDAQIHINQLQKKPRETLTPIDKKVLKAGMLSDNWDRIAKLAIQGDASKAYSLAMSAGSDDLYLLRLFLLTGPTVLSELPHELASKALRRLNKINRSNWLLQQ